MKKELEEMKKEVEEVKKVNLWNKIKDKLQNKGKKNS